ncbi:helix-turn-helix domain-containing protein [Nonomuraea sp. B19D2]|uniref:helix-turn-helix domain-containing protein n=1 Tax=Nonomuraea sp. B19D2 TaxID=3159561 RepID=UPI0032DAB736
MWGGVRITGAERQTIAAFGAARCQEGESVRALSGALGRSYGFVDQLIEEARVWLRSRGGNRRPTRATEPDAFTLIQGADPSQAPTGYGSCLRKRPKEPLRGGPGRLIPGALFVEGESSDATLEIETSCIASVAGWLPWRPEGDFVVGYPGVLYGDGVVAVPDGSSERAIFFLVEYVDVQLGSALLADFPRPSDVLHGRILP